MRISSRAVVIKDNQLLVMDRNKFGDRYLALLGGAVEIGEGKPEAAIREVLEESTIVIANPKLIIIEDAGEIYGLQYIYKCDYVSGEPVLGPESTENKINSDGKNLYTPKWLDTKDLPQSNLLPAELKDLLVDLIANGFPDEPIELKIAKDSKL